MKKKKQTKSRKRMYNTITNVTLFKSKLRPVRSFCSRVEISRKPLGTNFVLGISLAPSCWFTKHC